MNFEKFKLKWKIVKHFTRPKQRAALRKLFSLHQSPIPPDKILLNIWNKNTLREIYRNIQTFAFKVLQESSSWASGNGAVQMIFLTPNRNIFAGKFVNWESFLPVFWEHGIFNLFSIGFKTILIWKSSRKMNRNKNLPILYYLWKKLSKFSNEQKKVFYTSSFQLCSTGYSQFSFNPLRQNVSKWSDPLQNSDNKSRF